MRSDVTFDLAVLKQLQEQQVGGTAQAAVTVPVTGDAARVAAVPPPPLLPAAPVQPYNPEAMVELMVQEPGLTLRQYAQAFGRTQGWMATVLASEGFQAVMAERKHEVADPALTATLEERFRALAMRSLEVIQQKLDAPEVNDLFVLKAAEIGVKALGLGVGPTVQVQAPAAVGAEAVADRIMRAMAEAKARTAKAAAVDVEVLSETPAAPAAAPAAEGPPRGN